MTNRLGYIILMMVAFFGCKKVDINVPVDTPKFSVMATLDGATTLEWEAGNNDFYMFTEFEKDSLDIYTLIGRLAKDNNCISNCGESLTFKIRGNEVSPEVSDFNIDPALILNSNLDYKKIIVGGGSFDTVDTYTFAAALKSSTNPNIPAIYSWTINNSNYTDSVVIIQDTNFNNINFMVEMTDSLGCVASFSQTGLTINNNCSLDIGIEGNGPGNIGLTTFVSGIFSPEIILNNDSIQNNSIYSLDSIYFGNNLPLIINDFQSDCGFDLNICLELDNNTPNGGMVIDVKVPQVTTTIQTDVVFTPNPTDEQFSHVEIIYQDANGVRYSTFNGENSNNTFTITNVEEFEDNENGEKTKKLTIDYSANLYDANGNSKTISGSGVIGVAYPN